MTWHQLPPKAEFLFYLQAGARFLFFWVPATTVAVVALSAWWALMPAALLGAGWLGVQLVSALWLPHLAYGRWAWALRDEDLLIAHGVLFRTVTAIPVQRIQHVDTRQGPFEQWLSLARLQIYTASGMGADGVIPGLTLDVAEALRDHLVKVEGDDGV